MKPGIKPTPMVLSLLIGGALAGCSATETGGSEGPCTAEEMWVGLDDPTPIGTVGEALNPYLGTFQSPAIALESSAPGEAQVDVSLAQEEPLLVEIFVPRSDLPQPADPSECTGGRVRAAFDVHLQVDLEEVDVQWQFEDWVQMPADILANAHYFELDEVAGPLGERSEFESIRVFFSLFQCEGTDAAICDGLSSGIGFRSVIEGVPPGAEDGPMEPCPIDDDDCDPDSRIELIEAGY